MFGGLVSLCLCCCSLVGVFGDSDSLKSVTEGDSVTLTPDLSNKQSHNLIMWNFKTNGPLIAKINQETNDISIIDDGPDKRFKGRLELDHRTGSLTITNITSEHAGVYQVTISSKTKTIYRYGVIVYARLPVPVIISDSPQNSSSSSCSLLCSVVNVGHVTLSWYKGNRLLSSIGVSDFNNSLSLRLDCLDDSYSCVVNNPIRNQTQYLISDPCQPCSDCAFCCHVSEAVARLAVSVVVGVAAVVIVIYDVVTPKL